MRIYISSNHQYPARIGGLSGCIVLDLMAKGLAELGHDVFYHLKNDLREPLPSGIRAIDAPMADADVYHMQDTLIFGPVNNTQKPWIRTHHGPSDMAAYKYKIADSVLEHSVFVSRSQASFFGSERFVYHGIDPSEFFYEESKSDYFLFLVGGLERAEAKGLNTALMLVQKLGIKLVVAGSSKDEGLQEQFSKMCRAQGVEFVGEIYGQRKAELFAGARALLFPSQLQESFGLVAVEALMSGTPVICSDNGACSEVVSPEVGFLCRNNDEYISAVENIQKISPQQCRERAMNNFHYLKMASGYVKEYEKIALTLA